MYDADDRRLIDWIGREILPHEGDLRRWLRRALAPQDIEDAVQEIYCRISGLGDVSHIRDGRAYLFTTGRMLLLERIRRARVVSIETIAEIDSVAFAADEPSPEQIAGGRLELERVRRLIASLPDRCRRVFELRKIEGLSQREVAVRMGLPEHSVENDVAKGLRLILQGMATAAQAKTKTKETERDERDRRRDQ
jgi:RNA polymerase sigma factor (sigma-70 family)